MTERLTLENLLGEIGYLCGVVSDRGSKNVPRDAIAPYLDCQAARFDSAGFDVSANHLRIAARLWRENDSLAAVSQIAFAAVPIVSEFDGE